MKKDRICGECGHRAPYDSMYAASFCPNDGTKLREFSVFTDGDGTEIFLHKHKGENITAFGLHFRCGGYVYEHESSDEKKVLTCKACCLRIKKPGLGGR
jgi:hypothetical protein